MNSVGIEPSEFSHLIAKVKTQKYDVEILEKEIIDILNETKVFSQRIQKNQKPLFDERDFDFSRSVFNF